MVDRVLLGREDVPGEDQRFARLPVEVATQGFAVTVEVAAIVRRRVDRHLGRVGRAQVEATVARATRAGAVLEEVDAQDADVDRIGLGIGAGVGKPGREGRRWLRQDGQRVQVRPLGLQTAPENAVGFPRQRWIAQHAREVAQLEVVGPPGPREPGHDTLRRPRGSRQDLQGAVDDLIPAVRRGGDEKSCQDGEQNGMPHHRNSTPTER